MNDQKISIEREFLKGYDIETKTRQIKNYISKFSKGLENESLLKIVGSGKNPTQKADEKFQDKCQEFASSFEDTFDLICLTLEAGTHRPADFVREILTLSRTCGSDTQDQAQKMKESGFISQDSWESYNEKLQILRQAIESTFLKSAEKIGLSWVKELASNVDYKNIRKYNNRIKEEFNKAIEFYDEIYLGYINNKERTQKYRQEEDSKYPIRREEYKKTTKTQFNEFFATISRDITSAQTAVKEMVCAYRSCDIDQRGYPNRGYQNNVRQSRSKELRNDTEMLFLETAQEHGFSWVKDFVENLNLTPKEEFHQFLSMQSMDDKYRYVSLDFVNFRRDLSAIKQISEWDKTEEGYHALNPVREEARERLFDLIAKGEITYPYEQLRDFYLANDEQKYARIACISDEWKDTTKTIDSQAYKDMMHFIVGEIIKHEDLNTINTELGQKLIEDITDKDITKQLILNGFSLSEEKLKERFSDKEIREIAEENKILQERLKNEEILKKFEEAQRRLEQREKQVSAREEQVATREELERERETSVNVNEDLMGLTDEEKKQNFELKKKLMEEHLIMTEACLNSMCTSYYLTEDKELKGQMLKALYEIRKGGEKNKDKRDMAKTFKRVLDRNPGLKKDENLVALSKVDTPFAQPTKRVQKQVSRS